MEQGYTEENSRRTKMEKNVINGSSTTTEFRSYYTPYNYVDGCVNEIREHINDSNHTLQDRLFSVENTLKDEISWVQAEQQELLKNIK